MENDKNGKVIEFINGSKIEKLESLDTTVVRGLRANEIKAWWDLLEEMDENTR